VPGQHARKGALHPLAEVALALLRQAQRQLAGEAPERRMRRVRRAADLDRPDLGRERLARGLDQHALGEPRRGLGPEVAGEARLHGAGNRRLREDDYRAAVRHR